MSEERRAAALSVRGIGKHYGELVALHDVSFDLRAGEVLAIGNCYLRKEDQTPLSGGITRTRSSSIDR